MVEGAPLPNIYQEYIARVHRKEDFAVLAAGLSRLMNSAVQVRRPRPEGSARARD